MSNDSSIFRSNCVPNVVENDLCLWERQKKSNTFRIAPCGRLGRFVFEDKEMAGHQFESWNTLNSWLLESYERGEGPANPSNLEELIETASSGFS